LWHEAGHGLTSGATDDVADRQNGNEHWAIVTR
jgi:hypothetical protein